jgi:hypothetical protein
LHEKFHALYYGVGSYSPPGAAGMDANDDEDKPAVAPGDDDAVVDGGDGDVFDPDDGPEE